MNRYYQKFTAFHQSLISLLSIVATFCLKEMALVQRGSFTAGKPAKCALPLLVVLFILPIASFAATRYSVNTGNWNSTSTWSATSGGNSGASIPTAADIVYIYNGSSVTIPSGYAAACSQLHFAARNTSSPRLIFSASTSSLTITNDLVNLSPSGGCTRNLNVNAGTLTIGGDLLLNQGATSTSNKWETNMVITSGKVNLAGDLNIGNASGADYRQCEIYMSGGAGTFNLGGNMILGNGIGTLYGGTSSTFNYNGTSAQTVQLSYSRIVYNNLHINNPSATLNAAITIAKVKGNLRVQSGTLDNAGYAIAGNSKTLEVANGAMLKLGGTTGMPTGFTTKTIGVSSTIHYNGNNQTVSDEPYGNLALSGTAGTVVKTLPSVGFSVAGNFTSLKGTATTVSYTALNSIKIGGNVDIGASSTFNASSFTHAIYGDLVNNGTLTGSTSTITMGGSGKIISGSGSYNFNNLTITGSGIEASANTITIAGNLATTGAGTLTQTSGSTIMSGTTKTISGSSISLMDLTVSGTITSTSALEVSGNLAISSTKSLIMSAGSLTMSGANKTITNSGTLTLSNLTVTGNVTTASSFTISSFFDVADGTFTASAGTVTFTGTSTLEGTANLFNVTLNGTSLQLYTDAILGIAGTFTKTAGSLNVTTTTPNTVHYNGSISQNIPASNYHHLIFSGGTTTATGILTVNGNFTINAATTFAASTFTHVVNGSFINNGTFTAGTGTMQFSGATDASITGATTFNNITINKSTASASVNLQSNVSVATINMTLGTVKTLTNTLTITTTRTGAGIILGNILRSHAFSTGVTYEFEGQYNTVTFTAATGVTAVLVKVNSGTVSDFPNGSAINRLYDISVPSGTYIATLRLHYEDAELNGNAEANLNLYKFTTSWTNASKTSNNTTTNYVELLGQTDISNRWALSDAVDKIVSWNGSVSSAWATAANWTAVSGSPTLPPASNEIVQIGTSSYANAPVISTAVTVKSISFGSAVASTLSLTGGSLTVTGNIAGSWSADRVHTINANNQNITVNGSLNLSEGVSGRAINLNIGTGTVTVGGSVTQSGGANIVFSGAGNISVGGDYNYTNGTFTASTGTVTYTGSAPQIVAPVSYNNLTVNKTTNPATIGAATTLGGNLAITAGQLIFNYSSTINGNLTIASGATLTANSVTLNVKGDWTNSGTFTSSGTVIFNGTGAQTIGASNFNAFTIVKPSGTATLAGNILIAANLNITAGILDLSTFTANRTVAGGTLTIGSSGSMLLAGASNFPANFNTNTINSASTVTYNGTVAQTVSAKTYGNLVFTNGATNAKTAGGSFTVNGNVTINSGATFAGSSHSVTFLNNWTNSGTFTPGTSTLNFNGIAKTITGVSTFNNATINGSYTVANTNLNTTGQLWVNTGGTFNAGTGLLTVSGNLINNGSFISPGTVTITGTSAQTIQYSNALQTTFNVLNFNGNTAPIMTSTSSPTIATLVINNTAGITTSVDWTVTTSATINASCAFNGGVGVHRFQGSFINNGTITSSGEILFTPSTAQTIQLRGTNFTSSGTVTFGGTAALTVSGTPTTITNVVIDNSVGVTSTVGWSIAGDFTINPDKVFNASTFSYSVAGDFQGDGIMNPGTSTFTLSGTGKEMYSNEDISFYDLVISGTRAATSDYNVLRNFTNNGTYDGAGGMAIFTGDLSSTISGTAASFAMAQVGVQKSSAGLTVTLAKNITGVIELDVLSGTFVQSTFTVTQDAVDGGNLWVADNAAYKIAGTNSLPVFLTYNLEPESTVEYAGAAQSVSAATTYGHVIISTSGNKTAAAALSLAGNFSLAAGTFIGGNFTHNIGGNWTMTSGAFTNTNTKISLNGTADQTINSTGAFNNFELNKASGNAVLATDITINGVLNFISGRISTGAFKVIQPSTGSTTGASQNTGWVNGLLQKYYSSTAGGIYDIGGPAYYSPLTISFASVTTAGSLIAGVTNTAHPQINSSSIPTKNISRYWTLVKPASGAIVYTNSTITFNWNTADNFSPITPASLLVAKYTSSAWSNPTLTGATTTTQIRITGVTTEGAFAIGEACSLTTGFSYAAAAICSNVASSAITLNSGATSGTFTASPAGLSINSSTGTINPSASTIGTYTVTNSATVGFCSSSSNFVVTITALPAATISYAGGPFCTSGGTAAVNRTGTAGGTYSSTAGLTINSGTGTITPSTSTAGSYTVTYTIAAANGCAQVLATTSVTITALPSASISYAGSPFCTNAATVSVSRTGTSGGTYSSTAGLSINASTGLITPASSTAGAYTVTYTMAAANGCAQVITTTNVTITAAPSATISYTGSPYLPGGGTATVTRTGTTGGSYSSTAGLSINSSTGSVDLAASTIGTYTVTYTVAASGGCSLYTTTAGITIANTITWTGGGNTDWNTAGNWTGGIPSASNDVIIPNGLARYPVVSAITTAAAKNITVQTGGRITINGVLQVFNTLTAPLASVYADSGTIEFKGSAAQTLPAGIINNELFTLIVNNAAGVSLGGALNVSNLVSIQNGALTTNNFLTLRSNSLTTARVGAISSPTPNPITGNVTVERYVAGRRKYRLITSPVTTSTNSVLTAGEAAQSIWGNWQNAGVATSGVGTIITGGTTANGFDQGTTSASLYSYDANNRKFVAYTSANGKNTKQTPLTAGVGYYMFVYGDRINSITSSTPNPTTLKQTGTLLTGTQTYNPSSAIPISGTVGNYTLLGNPYACTIDWKSVTKTNVSKTIWGWDANLSSTGGYVTVTATVLGALVSPSSNIIAVNRYVQPGQAFFVQTTAANPQILITEADKIDDKAQINSAVFRESGVNEQPLMAINLLYKLGSTTTLLDGALVAYDDSFDNEVNYDDGLKMTGAAEVLAIQEGTSLLSISARKYPAANDTLTINLAKMTKSQYTLEIFTKELESSGLQPWLYDAFLNQMQALSLTDTNYINFTVKTSDPATYSANRFKIVFKNHVTLPVTFTNITAVRKNNDAEIQWNVTAETNLLAYELQRSTDALNFKTIASVLPKGNNNSALTYVQVDNNTTDGNNYYRVKSVDADGKQTLSKVVMVKMDNANPIVKVFPNPVREGKIFIQLSDFAKGKYMVILFNGSGQKIMVQEINHAGGAGNYEIDVDKRIAKGMYYLRLQNETESFNQTIVFE